MDADTCDAAHTQADHQSPLNMATTEPSSTSKGFANSESQLNHETSENLEGSPAELMDSGTSQGVSGITSIEMTAQTAELEKWRMNVKKKLVNNIQDRTGSSSSMALSESSILSRSSSNHEKQYALTEEYNEICTKPNRPMQTGEIAQQTAYLTNMQAQSNGIVDNNTNHDSDFEHQSEVGDELSLAYDMALFDQLLLQTTNENTTPTIALAVQDPESPRVRQRLEWQSMLASVLNGDVVRSEKKRISGGCSHKKDTGIKTELWLEIKAKTLGQSLEEYRREVDDARNHMDIIVKSLHEFQLPPDIELPAVREQVKAILQRYEACIELFPTQQYMHIAKPATANPDFVERMEALNSWNTIISSIDTQVMILKLWVGNEELHLTRPLDTPISSRAMEKTSFIERVLKESGIQQVFNSKILAFHLKIVKNAKDTLVRFHKSFQQLYLPSYMQQLLPLLRFPTKLAEEILRLRMAYVKALREPSILIINQTMEDLQLCLKHAVAMKADLNIFSTSKDDWDLPFVMEDSFDATLIEGLRFYFKVLGLKLESGDRSVNYKEPEILESEWEFFTATGRAIEGGDLVIAEKFSALIYRVTSRLFTYFESQLRGPSTQSAADSALWYTKLIENVRLRHRKLLRLSRLVGAGFQNATDYSIKSKQFSSVIQSLVDSGYFLAYIASVEHDGVYIVAPPILLNQPEKIKRILSSWSLEEPSQADGVPGFVLVMCPEEPFLWNGEVINVDMLEPKLNLAPGTMRLVADGPFGRLTGAKKFFEDSIDVDLELLVEQRANFPKVYKDHLKLNRLFHKLSITIIKSVSAIRKKVKYFDCQELIHNCFVLATEFGQRTLAQVPIKKRAQVHGILTNLALEWVGFICDDCVATDKKTFRWAVVAMEYAMYMTRGTNVLAITDNDFKILQDKVASCMMILISHFDIMGARSDMSARNEWERSSSKALRPNRINTARYFEQGAEPPLEYLRKHMMSHIQELEAKHYKLLESNETVGRVLDDSDISSVALVQLASSLSNIQVRWQQGRFLGGGAFGNVYVAVNLESGDLMAVKEIKMQDPKTMPAAAKSIKDEMTVLEVLQHPNVVSYYGIEVHRDKVYIFMEYCQGGSLASLLEHGPITDETVIQVYTLEMLEGLAYLHSKGIAHRDIKPENLLLDHYGIIKYVDFGAAKIFTKRGGVSQRTNTRLVGTNPNGLTGTPMYMAPEVITGSLEGNVGSMDVWSLGCCIIEMATGRRPWATLDNEWAIMYHIAACHLPNLPAPDQLSEEGQKFLLRCFERDPSNRATPMELLEDPWIQRIIEDRVHDNIVDITM